MNRFKFIVVQFIPLSVCVYLIIPTYSCTKYITQSLSFCPVIIVTSPRQVGKSTAKFFDSENLSINYFSGAFFETYVVVEIMKSFYNSLPFVAYYYRDSIQNEVGLIIEGNLHCIEIKKGSHYTLRDVKAFKQLDESVYPKGSYCIISNIEICYALNSSIFVYPVGVI